MRHGSRRGFDGVFSRFPARKLLCPDPLVPARRRRPTGEYLSFDGDLQPCLVIPYSPCDLTCWARPLRTHTKLVSSETPRHERYLSDEATETETVPATKMTGAEKHAAHAAHRAELRAHNEEKKRLKQEKKRLNQEARAAKSE